MVWSSPRWAQLFLRLQGLWEGVAHLPQPPPPHYDIESIQRIELPWRTIKKWIGGAPLWLCGRQDPPPDIIFHDVPLGCGRSVADDEPDLDWFKRPRNPDEPDPDWFDQRQAWKPFEIHLDDGRILVFD